MEIDLTRLSLADLKTMLGKSEKELQEKLLDGVPWNQSKALRDIIKDLRMAIYRINNPHDTSYITQIKEKLDGNSVA